MMKNDKTLLLVILTLLFISSEKIFSQVENGKFDNWTVIDIAEPYEDPVGWITSNYNTFGGFASVSVEKIEVNSIDSRIKIESKQSATDALISGEINQRMSTEDLVFLDYRSRCDSLAGLGYCLVSVLSSDELVVLYSDTIRQISDTFTTRRINFDQNLLENNDEIIIQFKAFGYVFGLAPEMMAYSIFILDEVQSNIISNSESPLLESFVNIFPNPSNSVINIVESANINLQSVEIYSLDGKLISVYLSEFNRIDVSKLKTGIYIARVISSDGRQISQKISIKK